MEEPAKTYTGRMHPETSYSAALSVEGCAANLRERVFQALEAAGAVGMTADEIEFTLRLSGNTVRPRLVELREEGRVERTLAKRYTRSGRQAYVYVACAPVVEVKDAGVQRDSNGNPILDLEF